MAILARVGIAITLDRSMEAIDPRLELFDLLLELNNLLVLLNYRLLEILLHGTKLKWAELGHISLVLLIAGTLLLRWELVDPSVEDSELLEVQVDLGVQGVDRPFLLGSKLETQAFEPFLFLLQLFGLGQDFSLTLPELDD